MIPSKRSNHHTGGWATKSEVGEEKRVGLGLRRFFVSFLCGQKGGPIELAKSRLSKMPPGGAGQAIHSLGKINPMEIREMSSSVDLPYVSQKSDFIVSLNHPIRAVYKNSQGVHAEGIAHTSKKPLEIIQDTTVFSKHIFVYQLFPEGKYRLLLP